MEQKVIKTEREYEDALVRFKLLISSDRELDTEEVEQLELLGLLLQTYESQKFVVDVPDALDAIRFRMEQQGLTQRDLLPYLGSRSKVSEVLSGKRPLTLNMIRALHKGLGIPAQCLLKEQSGFIEEDDQEIDWGRFPIKEMVNRGWLHTTSMAQTHINQALQEFFGSGNLPLLKGVLYRTTNHLRSPSAIDDHALAAWSVAIARKAMANLPSQQYEIGTVTLDFMYKVARLSPSDTGPIKARDFLRDHGISLVIEPHLSRTHLDGAAILLHQQHPIIGLSLRYDRLDNFWFTLMHELAHLSLHLGGEISQFFDDMEIDLNIDVQDDALEREADNLAREALIPQEAWAKSAASRLRVPEAAQLLAKELNIHPAIVAGRMRYEFKAFRLLNNVIGHYEVRRHFPEIKWEEGTVR